MVSEDKYRKYAKKVKLFNGLEPDDVAAIIKRGHIIEYPAGKTIFYQGQLGSNIFVVFSGTVGIYIDNKLIAKCRVGDAFGEMSALNHQPHKGTAVAIDNVKVFVLDEKGISQVLAQHVAVRFLLNIIHILSGHLEGANRWNAILREKLPKGEAEYDSKYNL